MSQNARTKHVVRHIKVSREESYWKLNSGNNGKSSIAPGQLKESKSQGNGGNSYRNGSGDNENGNANSNNGKGNGNSGNNDNGNGNGNGNVRNVINPLKLLTETTQYQYDGFSNNVIKEYTEHGSPLGQYYLANDSIVARKMFGLHGLTGRDAGVKTTGGMMYYNYDGLRNVSELTDRNGGLIEQYRYDAFGGLYTGVTAPYTTTGFAGQSYDPKASLVDMHARWYAPQTGRFTTADAYRGDLLTPYTQNRYAYVGNNPINRWDPTGYWQDGDENLSQEAQDAIWDLTEDYYATDDPEERERIHEQAEDIRNNDGQQGSGGSQPGSGSGGSSGGGSSGGDSSSGGSSSGTEQPYTPRQWYQANRGILSQQGALPQTKLYSTTAGINKMFGIAGTTINGTVAKVNKNNIISNTIKPAARQNMVKTAVKSQTGLPAIVPISQITLNKMDYAVRKFIVTYKAPAPQMAGNNAVLNTLKTVGKGAWDYALNPALKFVGIPLNAIYTGAKYAGKADNVLAAIPKALEGTFYGILGGIANVPPPQIQMQYPKEWVTSGLTEALSANDKKANDFFNKHPVVKAGINLVSDFGLGLLAGGAIKSIKNIFSNPAPKVTYAKNAAGAGVGGKRTIKSVTVKYGDEAVPIYRGGTDFTLKPGEDDCYVHSGSKGYKRYSPCRDLQVAVRREGILKTMRQLWLQRNQDTGI